MHSLALMTSRGHAMRTPARPGPLVFLSLLLSKALVSKRVFNV